MYQLSGIINKILGILAAVASIAALLFRAKSKQHKAEAEKQENRAQVAEASNHDLITINQQQQQLQQQQQQEQNDVMQSIEDGDRSHLDNNF